MEKGIKKWFRKSGILLFLLCLCLGGCSIKDPGKTQPVSSGRTSEGGSQVTGAKKALEYDAVYYPTEGMVQNLYNAKPHGNYIYSGSMDEIVRFNLNTSQLETFLKLKDGTEGESGEEVSVRRLISCFELTNAGSCRVLVRTYDLDENGYLAEIREYALEEYDADGKLLSRSSLENGTEFFGTEHSYGIEMSMDKDGNMILLGDGNMLLLSAKGEKIAFYPADGDRMDGYKTPVRTTSGEVWLYHSGFDPGVKRVDFKQGTLEALDGFPQLIEGIGVIAGGEENQESLEMLAYSYDKVYAYDGAKKDWVTAIEWNVLGISGRNVKGVFKLGENFVAFLDTGETVILKPLPEGAPGREMLVMVTLKKSEKLENMIATYNRSQGHYLVKIVEYAADAQTSAEYQDPANRMMMDVLGDDPPDLINLSDFFIMPNLSPGWRDMVDKEYLEDLGPYLDKSDSLGRDQYIEPLMAACTYKGVIAALPQSFGISTLAISAENHEKQFGWSIEDMIAYDKASPSVPMVDGCTAGSALYLSIYYGIPCYVDFEKKETHFDTQQFRDLMQHAATYRPGDIHILTNAPTKLIKQVEIYSLIDVQGLPHAYFDGNAQEIGYPTMDGSHLSDLHFAYDSTEMGICKRSKNKDGAWDFIEYTQQYDLMQYSTYLMQFSGIPARRLALEKCLEELSKEDGPLNREKGEKAYATGASSYPYHPFTEEETAFFHQLLESSKIRDNRTQAVWTIIYDEAKSYFEGNKSLDAVIDVIENRVNLYLNEN